MLVDHVDAVVLPVGAGDAEKEREPAPEAEPSFAGQTPVEDELVPLLSEVTARLLCDAKVQAVIEDYKPLDVECAAVNLALLAFSRSLGNQDGQVFALIVMVIAACEVVVGLGIIVAAYRRRIPLNVDDLRSLRG